MFDTPVAEFPSAPAERTLVSRVDELLVSETLNRALNFSIALIALIVLTPLILFIAVAVKLTSRGPIVYRQPRGGMDGYNARQVEKRAGESCASVTPSAVTSAGRPVPATRPARHRARAGAVWMP